jgi:hypothetical protein
VNSLNQRIKEVPVYFNKHIIVICITRLENAILQVQARFVGQRRQPKPTSAST